MTNFSKQHYRAIDELIQEGWLLMTIKLGTYDSRNGWVDKQMDEQKDGYAYFYKAGKIARVNVNGAIEIADWDWVDILDIQRQTTKVTF